MKGKLKLIAERSRKDKGLKFTSLVHHINEVSLAECYRELKRDKACGIDGVTVEEYGRSLRDNLRDLTARMKSSKYFPKPVRRVYIPKPGRTEKRGLGIPSVEDKLVQLAIKKILEAIYEGDFLDCSNGFRPDRNCHNAVSQLDRTVMTRPVNYVVEVDIEKFFDNVRHYWLLRCLEERITDPNFLLLIRRFLKAGVVEEGRYEDSSIGTPQGGIISPILANVYLHYVLDIWFDRVFKKRTKGFCQMIRYCDDFVVCFESRKDAERFLSELEGRFAKFGLKVSSAKTKLIEFGRSVWQRSKRTGVKVQSFNFLGFTHYCAASRKGKFVMGHKTSKQNLAGKLKDIKEWLKKTRNMLRMKDWWPVLKRKLTGHYNYFGISGNYRSIKVFYGRVIRLVFKWINRRSQRKSMNWQKYMRYLQLNPLPAPKIFHTLYTLSPVR